MEWRIPGSNRPRSENPHGDGVFPRGADVESHIGTHSGGALGASLVPGTWSAYAVEVASAVRHIDADITRHRAAAESQCIAHRFRAGWL